MAVAFSRRAGGVSLDGLSTTDALQPRFVSHTDPQLRPLPAFYAPNPPAVRTQRPGSFAHAPLERLVGEEQALRDLHASCDAARFAVEPPMRSSDDMVCYDACVSAKLVAINRADIYQEHMTRAQLRAVRNATGAPGAAAAEPVRVSRAAIAFVKAQTLLKRARAPPPWRWEAPNASAPPLTLAPPAPALDDDDVLVHPSFVDDMKGYAINYWQV